ncbi:unnamed protein product [Ectocarpus sp. 8 AP-2014]
MSLIIFQGHGVEFPSGEPVEVYVGELSASALQKLDDMTYFQEKDAMERYMNMYNKYYGSASNKRAPLSAERFASDVYVEKFRQNYAESEDVEDSGGALMRMKTAQAILHFLFVYYFSYHEAEEASGKEMKIRSFSTWFGNLRRRLGRKMQKEMEAREKAYNSLSGRKREEYELRLRTSAKNWKAHWRANKNPTLVRQFNEAVHVVTLANFDSKDWWEVFKIAKNRVKATGARKVQQDVYKNFRRWSRFFHPDKAGQAKLGTAFRHRLISRMQALDNKKGEMEEWFNGLAIEV